MSDTKGAGNDPSMDDILASIRKIISDEEARTQSSGAAPAATKPLEPGPESTRPPSAVSDDVLLLTDPIDNDPNAAPAPPLRPAPVPPVAPVPTAAVPPSVSTAKPIAPVEPSVKQPPADESIVEPGTAGLAASAFGRLSQAVQESFPQPVASDPGPSVGPNGRNLEDIVKELLRPMLKEWLDKNLPTMVERFVEREIVRLTRR